ncbi:MAG: chitobiase/beta-hexosaminidase C-terminal domain-containing protein, partial [Desulfobulbaceae bacterium]|nr:chitobiase/beta-hexosaminidase C-terminal domain-containing protein [Desulfobulbaceae bacterium]
MPPSALADTPDPVTTQLFYTSSDANISWSESEDNIAAYIVYRIKVKPGWDGADVVLFSQDWDTDLNGDFNVTGSIPNPASNPFKLIELPAGVTSYIDTSIEADTEYVYFVQAMNQVGENGRIDPASWRNTYMSMKAAVTGVSHPEGMYNEPIDLLLTTNTPAQIYYTLDGTEPDINSPNGMSEATISLSADTIVKFYSVTNDKQEITRTQQYIFDFTDPVITSFTPLTDTFFNIQDITIAAGFSDDKTGIDLNKSTFKVDGQIANEAISESSLYVQQIWPEGVHTVELTLFDKAGNTITQANIFTVDITPPSSSISLDPGPYNEQQTVIIASN